MKTSHTKRTVLILFTAGLWAFTCLPAAAVELNEALDNTTLVWTTGGPTPWFGQTTQTHDGVDAAQSGLLGNNQTNWIETTVTGPGVIAFWWKVSSEESYDFLRFFQDGRLQRGISGNMGWECPSYGVGPGAHTLRWAYGKDRADLAGADCGWVDGVTFLPPTVPMIIQQPTNQVAAAGGQASLYVLAIGQTPLSYQWRQNSQDLPGETNATLTLTDLSTNQTGFYSVAISNSLNSTMSASARLTVTPAITLGDAVDAPQLVWTTSGDAPWMSECSVTTDGVDAVRSGYLDNLLNSRLQTITGPGTISFWCKVSSPTFAMLIFSVNNTEKAWLSGELDWQQRTFVLTGKTNILEWKYYKDRWDVIGSDCAWLDRVSFTPDEPPRITQQPVSQTVVSGSGARFSVGVDSIGQVTCKWLKNGITITGSTTTNLILSSVTTNQAGNYSVIVSNSVGTAVSSNAVLQVLPPLDPNVATLGPAGAFGGWPGAMVSRSNYVYLAQAEGLQVLDVTDRQNPKELSRLDLNDETASLAWQSNYLYAALRTGKLVIFDLANPAQPAETGRCNLTFSWSAQIAVLGTNAYVACDDQLVRVMDVANPAAPRYLRSVTVAATAIAVSTNRAYVAGSQRLTVLDLSNPSNPTTLGFSPEGGQSIVVQGNYAYLGSPDGLRIFDISNPAAISRVAFYKDDGAVGTLAIEGSLAYLGVLGFNGVSPAFRILDLANPQQPMPIGRLPMDEEIVRLAVKPPTAFLVQRTGFRVVDVTTPASPSSVTLRPVPSTVNQTVVVGSNLYLATDLGPWIYRLDDPANPSLVKAYNDTPDLKQIFVADQRLYEIFHAQTNTSVAILDATNPEAMNRLGSYNPQRVTQDLYVRAGRLYLVNQYLDKSWLEVADVSNPVQATKLGERELPGHGRTFCIADNLAYVGWGDGTNNGVNLIDVSNPASLQPVATISTVGIPTSLFASGNRFYLGSSTLAGWWTLEMYDVSQPAAPAKVSRVDGDGAIWGLEVKNDLAFAAISGHSVYLFKQGPNAFEQASICESPASLGLAVTPPSTSGIGYIYTPDGSGSVRENYKSGYLGISIQRYFISTGLPTATLSTVVAPIEAGQQGCQTDPKRAENLAIGSQVQVTAFEADGWNFEKWTGAATGTNKVAQAKISAFKSEAVAHFVKPVLELEGGKGPSGFGPFDPALSNEVEVQVFSLTASPEAGWTVGSIKFQASGEVGNEKNDINSVRLYLGDERLGSGGYTADNGSISFNVSRFVPAGTTIHLSLRYLFKPEPLAQPPLPKYYRIETQMDWVDATPTQPAYSHWKKLPTYPITGGPVVIAPVWNVESGQGFNIIQEAIDAEDTMDGDHIGVSAGRFLDNVVVHKSLSLVGSGRTSTVVQAENTNYPVFEVLVNDVTISGFAILGASETNSAGVAGAIPSLTNVKIYDNRIENNGCGIRFFGLANSIISNNWIASNHGNGIYLNQAASNTITGNSVYGNAANGIFIEGPESHNILICENNIGVLPDGTTLAGNGQHGVWVREAQRINIGLLEMDDETNPDQVWRVVSSNVISGNLLAGLVISGTNAAHCSLVGNMLRGNGLGIRLDEGANMCLVMLNTITKNQGDGIRLVGAHENDLLKNIVTLNASNGVSLFSGSSANTLQWNYIGTDGLSDGLGNGANGVFLWDAPNNTIGGNDYNEKAGIDDPDGNVIGANLAHGILIKGKESRGNRVYGNFLGCFRSFAGLPRSDTLRLLSPFTQLNGVRIEDAGNNLIGLETTGNYILSHKEYGIEIVGLGATNNTIWRNRIGITPYAIGPELQPKCPNSKGGIHLVDAGFNIIGGYRRYYAIIDPDHLDDLAKEQSNWIDRGEIGLLLENDANQNQIRGNIIRYATRSGIRILNSSANRIGDNQRTNGNYIINCDLAGAEILGNSTGNSILGNTIINSGLESLQTLAPGLIISNAPNNVVSNNAISQNAGSGILIRGVGAISNVVQRNTIGCDQAGQATQGNKMYGIEIRDRATFTRIGGLGPDALNVISGNGEGGIAIVSGSFNLVQGNNIGPDQTGMKAIEINSLIESPGILLGGEPASIVGTNLIGGPDPRMRNVISGNSGEGIAIRGIATVGNLILGNLIGLASDGATPLKNHRDGIALSDSTRGNIIGDSEGRAGNTIAHNGGAGILLIAGQGDPPQQNSILANAIFNNGQLGIDLAANGTRGVTPNSLNDPHPGPNDLQHFPVLGSVQYHAASGTVVKGSINTGPFALLRIQFFQNHTPDPSGFGQGQTFLGEKSLKTFAEGTAEFILKLPKPVPVGEWITATATDELGNTSEFSAAVQVVPAVDTDGDGAIDLVESAAPSNGDANQDGIPDMRQSFVVSQLTETDRLITLVSPTNTVLRNVQSRSRPDLVAALPGVQFPLGLIEFQIRQVTTEVTRVELYLPEGVTVNAYYKYGPTPDDPNPHWYKFDYNALTGALLAGKKIVLNFVDGMRGDDDLVVNGIIQDLGGPAWEPPLRLGEVRRLADGQVQFTLENLSGPNYRIDVSTNLLRWDELFSARTTTNLLDVLDTNAPAFRQRFYRAVEWP